jgi:hypothetical protein
MTRGKRNMETAVVVLKLVLVFSMVVNIIVKVAIIFTTKSDKERELKDLSGAVSYTLLMLLILLLLVKGVI